VASAPDQVVTSLALAGAGFLPERASSVAAGVDRVFALVFWVSASFLALILAITVTFVVRYRARRSRPAPEPSPSQNTRLELIWTAIPLALALVIFVVGTRTWLGMSVEAAGPSALRIHVTARRWSWWFDHAGAKGAKELHLVAGRATELVLASTDVIHSLYVPAFRLKQDSVPGRFTRLVFTPTVPGTYPLLCAEYCGTNHSRMGSVAVVHPDQASFDAWAREGASADASLLEVGRRVLEEKGCSACHSVDGSPSVGPTLKGLWGRDEKLADGTTVRVDEAYVRESILRPSARLVAGYDDVMPPIPLEEREIQGVVAVLESLGERP
jgi:cytochrome c oxidase subunit II